MLVGTRRVMIREDVWVGEREGMVISLRDRRASVCLIVIVLEVAGKKRGVGVRRGRGAKIS